MHLITRLGRIAMLPTLAGLLFVAPTSPAFARQSDEQVEVTFCNKTSGKIFLALMYVETPGSDDWIVEGWKNISGDSCASWDFARGRKFFYFAEDVGPTGSWGADFMLCVSHPGPFRRINSGDYTCDDDELKGFKEVDPGDEYEFQVTLNP